MDKSKADEDHSRILHYYLRVMKNDLLNLIRERNNMCENDWLAIFYDIDKGIIKWAIIQEKISWKKAVSLFYGGSIDIDPTIAIARYRHKLLEEAKELEKIILQLELLGFEEMDVSEYLHMDFVMNYDQIEEELIWLDRLTKFLHVETEEIEHIFRLIREKYIEMAILEEMRVIMIAQYKYLREFLTIYFDEIGCLDNLKSNTSHEVKEGI